MDPYEPGLKMTLDFLIKSIDKRNLTGYFPFILLDGFFGVELYRQILSTLRKALIEHPGDENLKALAFDFYTGNDLSPWVSDLPNLILKNPPPSKGNLPLLPQTYRLLKALSKLSGRSTLARYRLSLKGGVSGLSFDPNILPSLVSQKWVTTSGTCFIRMSTPTFGRACFWDKPQIVPEFLAYLDVLKNEGKTHTYINLQDHRRPILGDRSGFVDGLRLLGIQNEFYRSEILKSLEHRYPGVFTYRYLSKDSLFYHQKGPRFGKKQDVSDFISDFWKEITKNGQTWILSPEFVLSIQCFLFPNARYLEPKEKRAFIEIVYGFLVLAQCGRSHFANISCKDAIDRAGCLHGLIWFMTATLRPTLPPGLEAALFSDALSVKHRPLLASRFKRFYEAALIWQAAISGPQRCLGMEMLEKHPVPSL